MASQSRPEPNTRPSILVVDDEVLIRVDISEYLRDRGYKVIEASSANEAIGILSSAEDVQLVFADIQMPEIDGFALKRWIEQNRPALKVLLTSGLENVVAAGTHSGQPRWLVPKPYVPQELEKRFLEMLGNPTG